MNRLTLAALALVVTVGLLIWWFHPNQILKRRTKDLMDTLTLAEGAGTASRNLKIQPLSRFIADEIVIRGIRDDRANGTYSRSQVETNFAALTRTATSTRFQIRHFDTITINGDQGTVRAAISAQVNIAQSNNPMSGNYNVTLTWKHNGDAWQLTTADWQAE